MTVLASIAAFLTSAIGRYVLIGGVVLALAIGIRQSGVNAERRKCRAAEQQRQLEIMQRDVRIGDLMRQIDERIAAEQAKTEEVDRAVQTKLEEELAKRPVADQCLLTRPDAERLR